MKTIAGYTEDQWKNIENEYEEGHFAIARPQESFSTLIGKILEGETAVSFSKKTGLSQNMFDRIKNRVCETDQPQRNTFISICVGYDLGIFTATMLLHSLELDFNMYSERDYAYFFLLTHCKGKNIDECNEILKELGVEKRYWLGPYARKNPPAE